MRITHQSVNVDLPERDFTGELEPHHDHAGDPEKDDVEAGNQYAGRVERFQCSGVFGPAQGAEGPEC